MNTRYLPSEWKLAQLLKEDDFFFWEYYGKGVLGKIQAWIFISRIMTLVKLLKEHRHTCGSILEVGCGSMFVSYSLTRDPHSEYVGLDVMQGKRMKKYKGAMQDAGVQKIEAVRASGEKLPFREGLFDLVLCLDVLEHMRKPEEAMVEIEGVTRQNGIVAISLPLENAFQKLIRIGFVLMRIRGDPILERMNYTPSIGMPNYHYIGDLKSYEEMIERLEGFLSLLSTEFTPLGFCKPVNINAIHLFKRKSMNQHKSR